MTERRQPGWHPASAGEEVRIGQAGSFGGIICWNPRGVARNPKRIGPAQLHSTIASTAYSIASTACSVVEAWAASGWCVFSMCGADRHRRQLAVKPQKVIPGQTESADRWLACEANM